jgi:1,2-dihydroxy-3-keto-5-methylthiopentene dioxygenase
MKLLDDAGHLTDQLEAIQATLSPFGVLCEQWPLPDLSVQTYREAAKTPEAAKKILHTLAPQLNALKQARQYQSEDIVALSPETPNLAALLKMFEKEHHHTDDEVRIILHGNSIFGLVLPTGKTLRLHVSAGDLLVLPAYFRHWFTLKEDCETVAIRVFKDNPQWEAIYEPV